MDLPVKYQKFLGEGFNVKVKGKRLELIFSDFEKFRNFLLVYEAEDFSKWDLEVNSFGECQGGCGQIFMGGLAGELISLAAAQAREMQIQGGVLIVHLCPLCQIKEAGGLQQIIEEVEKNKRRL